MENGFSEMLDIGSGGRAGNQSFFSSAVALQRERLRYVGQACCCRISQRTRWLLGGAQSAFHFVSPELPTDRISTDEIKLPQLRLAKLASDLLYSILQQDGNLSIAARRSLKSKGRKISSIRYGRF